LERCPALLLIDKLNHTANLLAKRQALFRDQPPEAFERRESKIICLLPFPTAPVSVTYIGYITEKGERIKKMN
jgi:hypothetical protein